MTGQLNSSGRFMIYFHLLHFFSSTDFFFSCLTMSFIGRILGYIRHSLCCIKHHFPHVFCKWYIYGSTKFIVFLFCYFYTKNFISMSPYSFNSGFFTLLIMQVKCHNFRANVVCDLFSNILQYITGPTKLLYMADTGGQYLASDCHSNHWHPAIMLQRGLWST